MLQDGGPGRRICATLVLHRFRSFSAIARERQTPGHRTTHPPDRRRVTICRARGTIREFAFRGPLKAKNYRMDSRNCQGISAPIAVPATARIRSVSGHALEITPKLSAITIRNNIHFKNADDLERYIAGMKAAGLSE